MQTEHINSSAAKMRIPRNFDSRYYIHLRSEHFLRHSGIYQPSQNERTVMLTVRLIIIALLVTLLALHIRSLRVFRWEQSVSGGVLVTYTIAVTGLALCSSSGHCATRALQAYISSTGAALLIANCGAIWRRWRRSTEATRALAELLVALGVPLRKYIILKVCLSALTAICMLIDLTLVYLLCSGAIFLSIEISYTLIELLITLDVPIRRYVILKICFNAAAALCMVIDVALLSVLMRLGSDRLSKDDEEFLPTD